MKKILIWVMSTLPVAVVAQYRLINPGSKQVFYTQEGGVHVISMDSSANQGAAVVFYDYRKLYNYFPSRLNLETHFCSPNRNSILGTKVIETTNGETYFITQTQDSVFFPSTFPLNASWTLFHRDSISIEAKVISIQLQNVLGFSDSVLTISLSCTAYPNLSVNGKQLKIGKTCGLIQTLDFFMLPGSPSYEYSLISHENLQLGAVIPVFNNVFDFSTGDVLENMFDNNDCGVTSSGITYNTILSTQKFADSMVSCVVQSKTLSFKPLPVIITDTVTWSFSKKEYLFNLPGQFPDYFNYHLTYDQSEKKLLQEIATGTIFAPYGSNTYMMQPPFEDSYYKQYAIGTGNWQYNSGGKCNDGWHFFNYQSNVSYYKKGAITWGKSQYLSFISGIDNKDNQYSLQIYPNPVKDILTIALSENSKAEFVLYDLLGQKIQSESIQKATNQIDLTSLKPGIYLYSVTLNSGQQVQGKLIKQ